MIEKSKTPYIKLNCGHFTDFETQELVAVWRPRKDALFCDICGKWVKMAPKPPPAPLPDEPMF